MNESTDAKPVKRGYGRADKVRAALKQVATAPSEPISKGSTEGQEVSAAEPKKSSPYSRLAALEKDKAPAEVGEVGAAETSVLPPPEIAAPLATVAEPGKRKPSPFSQFAGKPKAPAPIAPPRTETPDPPDRTAAVEEDTPWVDQSPDAHASAEDSYSAPTTIVSEQPSVAVVPPPAPANKEGAPKKSAFSRFAKPPPPPPTSAGSSSATMLAYRDKFTSTLFSIGHSSSDENIKIAADLSSAAPISVNWPYLNKPVDALGWDDPQRPAGSLYSGEEWAAASEGGKFVVFEVRNLGESGLVRVQAPPPLPLEPKTKHPNWKPAPAPELKPGMMDHMTASFFDRCLLIQEGAGTDYPHEISSRVFVEWPLGVVQYDLVRSQISIEKNASLLGFLGAVWKQTATVEQLTQQAFDMFVRPLMPASESPESESAASAPRP